MSTSNKNKLKMKGTTMHKSKNKQVFNNMTQYITHDQYEKYISKNTYARNVYVIEELLTVTNSALARCYGLYTHYVVKNPNGTYALKFQIGTTLVNQYG